MNIETNARLLESSQAGWRKLELRYPSLSTLGRTLAVAFQFGLLIVAIHQFTLVSRSFLYICILAFAGFLIHGLLPMRHRLPFFVALSLAGIVVALGPVTGAWLIVLGFGLVGICHLPVSMRTRIGLVAAAALGLGVLRFYGGARVVPGIVLTLLGSMFMFRMIIYLHDLPAEKTAGSRFWSLAYFFMLPNVCFPLFPVIDYKQFRATYFNQDHHRIYQRGVGWMFRGIYHLLIYRLIYLHFTLDPAEVSGPQQLLQYSVASFLLYLRVSGTFHLIVGILLLFGFNLPETHHHYYLASSFTDFWRRINIYWKEFMRRIFFFPANFALRRLGRLPALILSTMVVFLGTWVLHSYQWFWLTGTVLFETHDSLFWATLGVLVAVTMLYEDKHGTLPTWGRGNWNVLTGTALLCRTAATFLAICTLWGMWTADSLAQWLAMWEGTGSLWLVLLLSVALLYVASGYLHRWGKLRMNGKAQSRPISPDEPFWPVATRTTLAILFVLGIGHPLFYERLSQDQSALLASIRTEQLNDRDRKQMERGYYETLMSNDLTSGLTQHYVQDARELALRDSAAWQPTSDLLLGQLVPDARATLGTGVGRDLRSWTLQVNSLGMRDKEYSRAKPAGTDRVALLGASHVMGSGVNDAEVFEVLLEERVADERRSASDPQRWELLNFAIGSRSALQSLYRLQHDVLPFDPDTVIFVVHANEDEHMARTLAKIIRARRIIPYPSIEKLVLSRGITAVMEEDVIELRLQPVMDDLFNETFREFAEICRNNDIRPVLIYLPMTNERKRTPESLARDEMARAAGFTVLSLEGVYAGHAPDKLYVSARDDHPNAFGHKLIADRLYDVLSEAGLLH
jgi:D-alanyl-lipoteichoic acid acyltransferase DltB (MBOAT superfamily)